ncbi:MAG TPA: hypothetical protein VNF47_05245 [Streptosporangiaceae bacterium]|nr:hypothetical protein [Streptosporangiaceae bacterium]
MQQLPASPDAFVWLRLYQAQLDGLVPAGPDDPLLAVYPEEVINGHRAFIARRRAVRPGAEYRTCNRTT